MRKALAVVVSGLSIATQQLPKSGSISFHTGWKDTNVAIQVAEKRWQGQGMVTGATFNEKGMGPLHLGPANCSYTFSAVEGNVRNMGFCAFGDGDGDRIFTQFTGAGKPDGEALSEVVDSGPNKRMYRTVQQRCFAPLLPSRRCAAVGRQSVFKVARLLQSDGSRALAPGRSERRPRVPEGVIDRGR